MCMCLARGGRVLGVRGLGLGFTNPGGTWGKVGYVSVFWLPWCGWCGGEVGGGLGERAGVMSVCVVILDAIEC